MHTFSNHPVRNLYILLIFAIGISTVYGQPVERILFPNVAPPTGNGITDYYTQTPGGGNPVEMSVLFSGGPSLFVHEIPYYIAMKADIPGNPKIGDWTAAEIDCINKSANFWNNSGSRLRLFNDGTWRNKYQAATVFSTPGVLGQTRCYAIIKITQTIMSGTTPVWPDENSVASATFSNFVTVTSGESTVEAWVWYVLFNCTEKPYVSGSKGLYYLPRFTTAPLNKDEANNFLTRGNLPDLQSKAIGLIGNPILDLRSLTVIAAHEFGHVLNITGANEHGDDNTAYPVRRYDQPGYTYDFKSNFYNCYSSGNAITVYQLGKPSFIWLPTAPDWSNPKSSILYKESATSIVQGDLSNVVRPLEAVYGIPSGASYAMPTVVWTVAPAGTTFPSISYYWHLSIMSLGTPVNGVKASPQNFSYLTFGSPELLNPVAKGIRVTDKTTWSPSYKQIADLYGLFPETHDKQKRGAQ